MLTINFDPFPVIETEGLLLRRITHDDENELYFLRSNPDVMKYIDRPRARSVEDARQLITLYDEQINKNEGINWGIALKNSPLIIGVICLWKIQKENHRAEVGYLLHPLHYAKGIMNAALACVLEYGFNTLKLHSIEAVVNPDNIASIGLLEKNGFKREAYYKENYYYNGQFLDSAVYSLLTPVSM